MDAQTVLGDGISRVYGCPSTSETAQVADTTGIVFQFFTVRPELTVKDKADSILLVWSFRVPGFRLQIAEAIGQGLQWKDYQGQVVPDGDIFTSATIKKSELGKTRYFRLFSDSDSPPKTP